MDGKIGIVIGLAAGALLGAGGMYIGKTPSPPPDADAGVEKIVVTQYLERVVNAPAQRPPEERTTEVAAADSEQPFAFRPPDGGPGGTNENRRTPWPERGTAEWSNRVAQFRADMSNRFERFRADWTNRAATDRTNFIAKTGLNQDQAVRFDVLMTAMNVRLGAVLDPLVAQAQSGQFPHLNTEARVRLASEVSSALVNTYDEMNRAMPSDWSSNASSNHIRLTSFVQPEYLPFVDRVTSSGHGGPPGGGWGGDRGGRGGNRAPGGGGGGNAQPAAGAAK